VGDTDPSFSVKAREVWQAAGEHRRRSALLGDQPERWSTRMRVSFYRHTIIPEGVKLGIGLTLYVNFAGGNGNAPLHLARGGQ
jgi:hypothetical protein